MKHSDAKNTYSRSPLECSVCGGRLLPPYADDWRCGVCALAALMRELASDVRTATRRDVREETTP